ncbi:MAG: glycosyltransferase family 1 protein [Vulcanimicrobiaceae bacterium]
MNVACIVVGSHLRFDGVWQRPQQIVTRLAARVPVLFVEEPLLADDDRDELRTIGNVTVLRPRRRERGADPADARTRATVAGWIAGRAVCLWLYTPMMLPLTEAAPQASLAYDCMDELAAFDFAPPSLRAREADLLARAGTVFCGGRSLFASRRHVGERAILEPSGVEFDHFASARARAPHALLANLPHPICGYVGVIDERIDIGLVEALATRDATVIMVGPIVKIDPVLLPQRTNVHFTGQVAYETLPSYLAGFDVALLPFARNAATANISPTKTPEYLAAGVPVVSTRIADVVAAYGDVVTFADDPDGFADAALAAVATSPARIAAGIARAREAGWDAIVDRMWSRIEREAVRA